ncbi:MAG TPA: acyl-CoA reductase, partial [Verrucomicrobiae bacterium]|nr:acyl-CoA reductase [Verrucomicrobiae bacterium]
LHRFIYVKAVADLAEALRAADPVRGKVSTVGIAVPDDQAQEIAVRLARWGATRVCPLGQMQNPPLTWRHDGRPALGDLVTWTDWEQR